MNKKAYYGEFGGQYVAESLMNTLEELDRAFEEAACLAAYYSKNRDAEKVEIDYVEKKHVKKPNGAKPGFVVYYTNYSMMIDPDIRNLTLVSD